MEKIIASVKVTSLEEYKLATRIVCAGHDEYVCVDTAIVKASGEWWDNSLNLNEQGSPRFPISVNLYIPASQEHVPKLGDCLTLQLDCD